MNINSSDKICVIGYSGAGKSTLMEFLIDDFNFDTVVIDPVSRFSSRKNIRYVGKVKCKHPRDNKVCFKIQDEDGLEKIIKTMNDNDHKDLFLIVDEIDQYTTTRKLMPETSLYFQQGRNYNHGGMVSVRQVGRLNKQILSNSHYLFLFKVMNESDVEYLENITGLELKKNVLKLDRHNFFIIDLHNSEILGIYRFDKKKKAIIKDIATKKE